MPRKKFLASQKMNIYDNEIIGLSIIIIYLDSNICLDAIKSLSISHAEQVYRDLTRSSA